MITWKKIIIIIIIIIIIFVLTIAITACNRSEPQIQTFYEKKHEKNEENEENEEKIYFDNVQNANYFLWKYGEIFGILDDNEAMKLLRMDTNPFIDIEMIGWSNRGLFSYRYRYLIDDGMINCWVYSIVVINAVTDEIVRKDTAAIVDFNKTDETAEYVDTISNLMDYRIYFKEELRKVSTNYRSRWNAILRQYNIAGMVREPFSESFKADFLQFPINNYYGWLEHNIITNHREERIIDFDIVRWKLIIGNNRVQKIIAERENEAYKIVDNISGRKILGYYKSPYENRIVAAVIYYNYSPISGGNFRVGLDVFGCNMNVGLNY